MKLPVVRKCPGCGRDPLPFREGPDTPGVHCDRCGFNASDRDVVRADYLANFRPLPAIRVAAERIAARSLLKYTPARTR